MTGTVENVWMIDVAAAVFGHVFFVVESQLVEQRVRLECANLCTHFNLFTKEFDFHRCHVTWF